MKKKNRTLKFFVVIGIVLAVLASVLLGGYFFLDKYVVPKYFGEFGINNLNELVGMMTTLYNNKSDEDIATYAFTTEDKNSAESKLIEVGFPKLTNGSLDYKKLAEGTTEIDPEEEVVLSDKELASVLNGMLESGVLSEKLPNLKYINTLNMRLLELIITPQKNNGELDHKKANCQFTIKIDTSAIKIQIAEEMEMPIFLLNMIVPKTMYVTTTITLEANDEGEWAFESKGTGVNGRTAKQSEILLNLLIKFIFPPEDEMTLSKFNNSIGEVIIEGTKAIGNAEFTNNVYNSLNGIIVKF